MLLKVFIRTKEQDVVDNITREIISCFPDDLVGKVNYRVEPYWKYNDTTVIEILAELLIGFDNQLRNEFLYSMSDKWIYFDSGAEALTSKTMEGGCNIKFDYIDIINIFFN